MPKFWDFIYFKLKTPWHKAWHNVPDKTIFTIKTPQSYFFQRTTLFRTIWLLQEMELQNIFTEKSHIYGEIERLKTSILILRWVFVVPILTRRGTIIGVYFSWAVFRPSFHLADRNRFYLGYFCLIISLYCYISYQFWTFKVKLYTFIAIFISRLIFPLTYNSTTLHFYRQDPELSFVVGM